MKRILLIILIIAIGIYFLFKHYFGDIQINKYDSLTSVQEHSAIQKGWIPKVLPSSAYDIVETHDMDTHNNFGKFSYKEKDEANLISQLILSGEMYSSDNFLFKINKEKNEVKFRNKVNLTQ